MRSSLVRVGTWILAALAISACSSGGGDSSSGGGISGLAFTQKGGKGTAGGGGNGGYFDVEGYGGGDVKVVSSGSINTSVSLPTRLPYLGTNWQDVTTDTTLGVGSSGFYLTAGTATVSNGTGTVTGIRVRPGVTLTIRPNYDTDNADADGNMATGTREEARFYLSDGLIVEGAIKIATMDASVAGDGAGTNTANLNITGLGGLFVASTGKIDVSGADNGSGPGRNAGYFYAFPDAFNNAGVITAKGGAGSTSGGNGGAVYVYTYQGYAASTGSVVSDGGAGAAGAGGGAGWLDIESGSGYGYLVAKGVFSATGGNGTTGGGNGSSIYLYTDWGAMIADGTFRTYGGNATVDGSGGYASYVDFDSYGDVRVTGTIDTHGGNGTGSGNGGGGSDVYVYGYENQAWGSSSDEPNSGGVYFGASVNGNGGDGASGGYAGNFYVYQDTYGTTTAKGTPIQLVGYSTIDLSGGNGSTYGGSAGSSNYLEAFSGYDNVAIYYAGNVHNDANFVMRGGDGATGYGGSGQGIYMETESSNYPPYNYGVKNVGSLDGSGGAGGTAGGGGGYFHLYGKFYVDNSGAITASGGRGGTSSGGYASEIDVYSDVSLTCSGALAANGGSSASGNAYGGGSIYVSAANTATVGTVSANGGNSTSAAGGNGGYVWIMSQDNLSQVGSATANKGSGASGSPVNGEVWIDGMQVM